MATKEHKRHARGLIEGLESRVHLGPPIDEREIHSAQQYLRQNGFPPTSDYFGRLGEIRTWLEHRTVTFSSPPVKRNYGGEAGGRWMQLQCAFDHLILSTCYDGKFNSQSGRIKISHRFNEEGRVDFVELKFLRSLHPLLNGELRKLLVVKGFPDLEKSWHSAEAFVLPILPRELIFLYQDIFRCNRHEVLAWLINIGHRIVADLLDDLKAGRVNGHSALAEKKPDQLCLTAVRTDDVAVPILENVAILESAVDLVDEKNALVRYVSST